MFRIRLHGRGGQGIKTAGQVLGSAFFREGFEVQDAPRYGAERRGAPIFSFVRAARFPIAERGVISRPDLVLVADESLIQVPAAGVLQGIAPHTVLLMASGVPADTWRTRLAIEGPLLVMDPGADRTRTAMPLIGAAARLTGAIRRDSLVQAVHDEGARSEAETLAAYDAFAEHAGLATQGGEVSALGYAPPDWIELALDDAAIAAPGMHRPATSVLAKTGVWRTQRPVIDDALCNRCSWICSTLCPDSAITVDAARKPEIDYDHCKGCMVCVAVCPPHAIAAIPERA